MKYSRKFFAVFVLLACFMFIGSSQSLDGEPWNDVPNYFQDATVDVRFSDVVEEKETYQSCDSYENLTYENGTSYGTNYSDCTSYTTEVRGGVNTYVFGIENIDYSYLGNGNVRLSFDVVRNDLTKELYQSQLNPVQEDKFIDYFNSNYLFREKSIDSNSYDTFLDYTQSVSVSSLGDSLKAKRLSEKNFMAVSNSRVETVVKLEEFRSGGVKLNDAVTVEVSSGLE